MQASSFTGGFVLVRTRALSAGSDQRANALDKINKTEPENLGSGLIPRMCSSSNMVSSHKCNLKGAQSRYFELFWPHTKLPLNGGEPENNSLIR